MRKVLFFLFILLCGLGVRAQSIEKVEYWFDSNFSDRIALSGNGTSDFTFAAQIVPKGLADGMHTFHFRAKDVSNKWGSVKSSTFYHRSVNAASKLTDCEYWFDDEFSNRQIVALSEQQPLTSALLSTDQLSDGFHVLRARYKNSEGMFGSVISRLFYRMHLPVSNKITAYRYWIGERFGNKVEIELEEQLAKVELKSMIDLSGLVIESDYNTEQTLCMQYKDTSGKWGSVIARSIQISTVQNSLFEVEFMVVNNQLKPIEGATVKLEGYGEAISDEHGIATFSNVEAVNPLDYTVSKSNYELASGTISKGDENKTKTVQLSPITYEVSFIVGDGSVTFSGVEVSLDGYGTEKTADFGKATFTGVSPNEEIGYTVRKDGYEEVKGVLSVTNEDATTYITLIPKAYSVRFQIMSEGIALPNAIVSLQGYDELVTDEKGEVVFPSITEVGSLSFSVTAEGYDEFSGTVAMNNQDIERKIDLSATTYSVAFVVTENGQTIANAEVYLEGYDMLKTDNNGRVVFSDVLPNNNLSYTVNKPLYKETKGVVILYDRDIEAEVELLLLLYNVTFTVGSNGKLLEGATVTFGEFGSKQSDSNGQVTFENIAPQESVDYSAELEGYELESGTLSIVNKDVVTTLELTKTIVWVNGTFVVVDEQGEPVSEVEINLNSTTSSFTNDEGEVIFEHLQSGTLIEYTVENVDYGTQLRTVMVPTSDFVENIVMKRTRTDLLFTVLDDKERPVQGVEIHCFGQVALTNENGLARILDVPVQERLVYKVHQNSEMIEEGVVEKSKLSSSYLVQVMVTPVEELEVTPLKIYPNPANEMVVVEFSSSSKYKLCNMQGSTVGQGEIAENKTEIFTSQYPSGIYLLLLDEGQYKIEIKH